MCKCNELGQRVCLLLLFMLCLLPISATAQSIQISGTVSDVFGEPIIGASVLEKGTTNGIMTDFDGNFSLTVPSTSIIVVSYVGYATQEIPVNGQKSFNIILKEDNELLDEVVVVGYGTMKKSDMTGAISSVNAQVKCMATIMTIGLMVPTNQLSESLCQLI